MSTSTEKARLTLARRLRIAVAVILIVLIGPILVRCAPHIYYANFYENPIADRTFSVDFEIHSEGEIIRLSRNYACDDQYRTSDDANTYYYQFPSNRIASHKLKSGAGIYVAVPNPCLSIARAEGKGIPCSDGKAYGFSFPYIQNPDCSGEHPVVRGHIPAAFWTPNFDDPHTLYMNTSVASYDSPGSKIQKAEATITIKDGLKVSPRDAESWIEFDLHDQSDFYNKTPAYSYLSRNLASECARGDGGASIRWMRNGADLRLLRNTCEFPASRTPPHKALADLEGILIAEQQSPTMSTDDIRQEVLRFSGIELGAGYFSIRRPADAVGK